MESSGVRRFESDNANVAGLYYGRNADTKVIALTIAFDDVQAILQMASRNVTMVEFVGTVFVDRVSQYRVQLDDDVYDALEELRARDDYPTVQKIPSYVLFNKQMSSNVQ